jgi:hypothetical protein
MKPNHTCDHKKDKDDNIIIISIREWTSVRGRVLVLEFVEGSQFLVCSTSNTVLLAPVDKKKNKKEYNFTSQPTTIRMNEKKLIKDKVTHVIFVLY